MPLAKKLWGYVAPGGRWFVIINVFFLLYGLGVQWMDDHCFPAKKFLEADAALYTSAIVGLLLVFRTNSAYDRWWEARKLWGALTNDVRNLTIKVREYTTLGDAETMLFAELLVSFAYALKDHLRGESLTAYIPAIYREEMKAVTHVPLAISTLVYRQARKWNKQGLLSDVDLMQLDPHMKSLMDVCGACERIRRSPITGSYKFLLWIGLASYFLILPWLLVPTLDQFTFISVSLSAYFVTALEFLAEEVEEPFGTQANDLPLDTICTSMEASINQVFRVKVSDDCRGRTATTLELPKPGLTEAQLN